MKTKLSTLFALIICTLFTLTACTDLTPDREYPTPGYVQSDQVIPNTINPVVEISLVPDVNVAIARVPFRVNTFAIHRDGQVEKVSFAAQYKADGNLSQTNINEFEAFAAGEGTITATYEGVSGTMTIFSEQ